MNCTQSRQHYLRSQFEATDAKKQGDFEAHIATCDDCKAFIATEESLTDALSSYADEAAPGRLLGNVMQQIDTQQKLKRYRMTNIGFGLALAASLFLAVLLPGGHLGTLIPSGDGALSTITMSMDTQRTVNIVFDSPESVADATITISLPDNIRLAGYEHKQTLQWNTKLNAGKNTLKLPLVASNTGSGIVLSTLEINGKSKNIKLQIDVSTDKISTTLLNTATV